MQYMSFEPEFVSAAFDEVPEFIEDFRKRLITSPVFERAMVLQREFLQTRLSEEDLEAAWVGSQSFLRSLDLEANEQGILNKEIVILRGKDVEIPKFEADLNTAIGRVTLNNTVSLDEKSIEKYYHASEVRGIFSGFTLRYAKTDHDTFIPKLAYQVLVGTRNIPHAHVSLYATGIVGTSQLSFQEDEKVEAILPLLEKLFAANTDQAAGINFINMALSSTDTYDDSRIRHIAYHIEKVVNETDEEAAAKVEDLLIDLFSHYIEPGETISMKTPLYSFSSEDNDDITQHGGDDTLHQIVGENKGLVFLPEVISKDDTFFYGNKKALNMVTAYKGQNLYTPLAKIREFSVE